MPLPQLTFDDIRRNGSERSFERGYEYYEIGAIGNPVRYGYTLWADCEGSGPQPYRIRVQLMPSGPALERSEGIAQASCSCPYRWDGYCKHIVALLLTYLLAPEAVTQVEAVLRHLESQPTSHAIHVLAELLQRAPELVPVTKYYASLPPAPVSSGKGEDEPSPDAVYAQQVDALFGAGFIETEQVYTALQKLTRLKTHAEELAGRGEPQLAQIVLLALIQTCIARYEDTSKRGGEIPRFVWGCAEVFVDVALARKPDTGEHQQQLGTLLDLSFRADGVFTAILTLMLQQVSTPADVPSLERTILGRLPESPARRAHIRLLLGLYARAHRMGDYLTLARQEGEGFLLAMQLLEGGRTDEMWEALGQFPLSADEYWHLLHAEAIQEFPEFDTRLS